MFEAITFSPNQLRSWRHDPRVGPDDKRNGGGVTGRDANNASVASLLTPAPNGTAMPPPQGHHPDGLHIGAPGKRWADAQRYAACHASGDRL